MTTSSLRSLTGGRPVARSAADRLARRVRETRRGDLLLRPPRCGDGPALVALSQRVLEEGRWFLSYAEEQTTDPHVLESSLLALDTEPHSFVRLAERGSEVVGFATVVGGRFRRLRHVGTLEIRVDRPARGQGVGRALVGSLVELAELCPVLQKLSLAVFADNSPAIGLYRSLGFIEEGRRIGEYREEDGRLRDDLIMARSVRRA